MWPNLFHYFRQKMNLNFKNAEIFSDFRSLEKCKSALLKVINKEMNN